MEDPGNIEALLARQRTDFEAMLLQQQQNQLPPIRGQNQLQQEALMSPGSFFLFGQFSDGLPELTPTPGSDPGGNLNHLQYPLQLGDLSSVSLSTMPLNLSPLDLLPATEGSREVDGLRLGGTAALLNLDSRQQRSDAAAEDPALYEANAPAVKSDSGVCLLQNLPGGHALGRYAESNA